MPDDPASSNDQPLPHTIVRWDDEGLPVSHEFGDYYFSKLDGLQETRYVYLDHNFLEQRWAALTANDQFVIGETGFGTGLNFLASWQLWKNTAPDTARLHFISVEKSPLSNADLSRALALWPELQNETRTLLSQYPAIVHPGFHRLSFDQGRVSLTLIVDEACDGLEQLLQSTHPAHRRPQRGIDAWFLDGFSPAKNPDMWRPQLFELIQQLSAPHASVATYAAATIVQRGLNDHGFELKKDTGFGKKREMVYGQFTQPALSLPVSDFPTDSFNSKYPVPWNIPAATFAPTEKQAVVIGGGIAGCHTARSLAERGWQVTILERHSELAQEGSGNPQGVLYAKLSHRQETLSDFNLLALQFAQRAYLPFWGTDVGDICGVLQLACNDKTEQLHEKLHTRCGQQGLFKKVDKTQASELSGIASEFGGLFFPQSGWINPATLCRELTNHPNINIVTSSSVTNLAYDKSAEQWSVEVRTDERSTNTLKTPVVVLSTASHVRQFPLTDALPLKPIRGQVTYVTASPQSSKLKTVLCGDGYLPPAIDGRHCLGATFDPRNLELTTNDDDHQRNLNTMQAQVPSLSDTFTQKSIEGGRAALRCTTPDYLPLVGAVPKYDQFLEEYALLRKNARANIPAAGSYWPGLFINVGHGSRGLAYTPICAELLASQINGEPTPVGSSLQSALHPGRFWIRDLIRKKR